MPSTRARLTDACLTSIALVYLSGLIIYFGVEAGSSTVLRPQERRPGFVPGLIQMDGRNYQRIAAEGYRFDPGQRSLIAFFPVYPVLCAGIQKLTGLPLDVVLLLVSNVFLALTIFMLYLYLTPRDEPTPATHWALAAFCLMPATFFLRSAYAESLLSFWIVLVLYGMSRRWPLGVLALCAGIATGTRPTGIALAVAVWWYAFVILRQSGNSITQRFSRGVRTFLWLAPLSCVGLIGYASYLWWKFDAPLAFAQVQSMWSFGAPAQYTAWDKAAGLLTLEPIWNVFNPNSSRYWMYGDVHDSPTLSLLFWNPVFFVGTWILVGLGIWKRWLTGPELVLSVGLLLIPYLTRAYEMSMASHARFAAVVLPQYLVLGRLLAYLPTAVSACLAALMGLAQGWWTALFLAGYSLF